MSAIIAPFGVLTWNHHQSLGKALKSALCFVLIQIWPRAVGTRSNLNQHSAQCWFSAISSSSMMIPANDDDDDDVNTPKVRWLQSACTPKWVLNLCNQHPKMEDECCIHPPYGGWLQHSSSIWRIIQNKADDSKSSKIISTQRRKKNISLKLRL